MTFVKPILEEVSRTAVAEQLIDLLTKCAASDSVKTTVGAVAATTMPVLFPAVLLVGMGLFKYRGEREKDDDFRTHCEEVIQLLRGLDGRVDVVAEKLDDIMQRRTWIHARLSGADQHQLARCVANEVQKFLQANGLDARDRLEGLQLYAVEVLRVADGIAATQEQHTRALNRIEHNQDGLASRKDLDELKQDLLAEIRSRKSGQLPPDKSVDTDLVAAVNRIARDAQRGGLTARQILEGDNPSDVANYLILRRVQIDSAQQLLNQRVDEEKIGLDRELAAVAYTIGRIDDAAEAIERILSLIPDDIDAHNRRGHIQSMRGQLTNAETSYRRVLELSAGNQEWEAIADGNLGNVLKTRGDLDGAEAMYDKSLEINEKLGRLEGMANQYCNLGNVLKTRGDLDGAEAMYHKSLKIDEQLGRLEGMAIAYGNLGIVLQTRGDLDGGRQMLTESSNLFAKLGNSAMVARVRRWIEGLDIS
jgi:tetratricopeptide (TPR) repeat protein